MRTGGEQAGRGAAGAQRPAEGPFREEYRLPGYQVPGESCEPAAEFLNPGFRVIRLT
jgi:hypothetical protein